MPCLLLLDVGSSKLEEKEEVGEVNFFEFNDEQLDLRFEFCLSVSKECFLEEDCVSLELDEEEDKFDFCESFPNFKK